jgi:steroid delta-isomerase-like uncharacterized protein
MTRFHSYRLLAVVLTLFLTAPVIHSVNAEENSPEAKLFKAWAEGWSNDMEKLLPIFTDDVVYEDATMGVVNHGKEELRAFAAGFFTAFPDATFTLHSSFAAGNWAAMEWTLTGTQKGDMPGMPATNKRVSVRGSTVIELKDGKISRNTDYWDMATLMRQLGYLPPPK